MIPPPRIPGSARAAEPATAARPGPSPLGVLQVYFRRDLSDRKVFRLGLVLDIGYGLVNLLTFLVISRVLHLSPSGQWVDVVSYFDFVAVGLAYFLVVQSACTQIATRALDEQRSGTLEATAALPVSPQLVALGFGIFPVLLGVVRAAVYLIVAIALLGMSVDRANWVALVVMLVLGTVAALAVGIALAAIAVAFSQGAAVGRVFVVGLSFLSGVYFPVAVLPGALSWIARLLPTSMAVQGLRSALVGGAWGGTAVILAVVTAALLPASTGLFHWAMCRARNHGTLTRG